MGLSMNLELKARQMMTAANTSKAVHVDNLPAADETLAIGEVAGHVGYFARRLQVWIFRDFIRTLAPVNLRPAQYSVLLVIEANPGRSQAAIGKTLNIERSRLARLLHELERRKSIERRSASGGNRSIPCAISDPYEQDGHGGIKGLGMEHEEHVKQLLGARRLPLMELLKTSHLAVKNFPVSSLRRKLPSYARLPSTFRYLTNIFTSNVSRGCPQLSFYGSVHLKHAFRQFTRGFERFRRYGVSASLPPRRVQQPRYSQDHKRDQHGRRTRWRSYDRARYAAALG